MLSMRIRRDVTALAAVNLGAVAYFLLKFSAHGIGFGPYRIDLDVYRIGSRVWLDGGNLYGTLPPTASGVRLPFSYPPVAAAALSPLALLPMAVAGVLLTLLTVGLTAVVLRLFLAAAWPRAVPWRTVGGLLPAALVLEPVRNTISYGQVNVLLMALVAADCLVPNPRWPHRALARWPHRALARWPRGALVGLAAAVKLTPAAFVLFFLLRRDWRAAGTAALSFCVATGAGFALAPRDSVRYWTSVLFDSGRPGSPVYAANQSIEGVLARTGLAPDSLAGRGAWLAAAAVVVLLACLGMRHALARCLDAWALSLNALAALLVSPISWSHHWVWGETAMLALACLSLRERRPARRRRGLALAAAGTALFAAAPQWWFPSGGNRELGWAWWEQLTGSSYVIFAVFVLLVAAAGFPARSPEGPAPAELRETVREMQSAAPVPD